MSKVKLKLWHTHHGSYNLALLPKWAQEMHDTLQRQIQHLKGDIDHLKGDMPTRVESGGLLEVNKLYLPEDRPVRFRWPHRSSSANYIEVMLDKSWNAHPLIVRAAGPIAVIPEASNACRIRLVDYHDILTNG